MQRAVAADIAPGRPLAAQVRAPWRPVDGDIQGAALHMLPRAGGQLPPPVLAVPLQPERPRRALPAHGEEAVRDRREGAGHVVREVRVALAFADLAPRPQVREVAANQPA